MASLGDVNFRLRGDTEGFTRGMLNAARSIDTLERDIRQLHADFRAGRVHIEEYRRSMAALNEQAKGVRTGIGQIAFNDLPRLKNILQQTAPQAEKVGLSMRSLRGPLATVAAQAVGVSGSLGSLGSILLSLGTGSTVGLAAIAGIGAIAFAFKKLGEAERETHKAYEDYLDTIRKKTPLAIVGAELDVVTEKYKRMATLFNRGNPSNQFFEEGGAATFKKLGDDYRRVKGVYDGLFAGLKDNAHKNTKEVDEWKSATMGVNNALKSLNSTWNEWRANVDRPILFTQSFVTGKSKEDLGLGKIRDGIVGGVEDAAKSLSGKDLLPPELRGDAVKEAERLGQSMARSIASGFTSAGGGIGAAIKNVFRSALDTVIEALIKPFLTQLAATVLGAFGKGAGGKFGVKDLIGAGVGIGIGVISGGIFSRSSETVVNVPASRSPMDQARDAFWLSTMAETMRALQSNNSLRVVYTR